MGGWESGRVGGYRECSESCGIGILPVPAKQARRLPYKACGKLDGSACWPLHKNQITLGYLTPDTRYPNIRYPTPDTRHPIPDTQKPKTQLLPHLLSHPSTLPPIYSPTHLLSHPSTLPPPLPCSDIELLKESSKLRPEYRGLWEYTVKAVFAVAFIVFC